MTAWKVNLKKTVAIVAVIMIALAQIIYLTPEAFARETALEIRVQYLLERGDMVRLKTTITSQQLDELSQEYYYANIRSTGNVLVMHAMGVPLTEILNLAGIDVNSVECIYPDTDDHYGVDPQSGTIHVKYTHNDIVGTGWYYPMLNVIDEDTGQCYYERNGSSIRPLEGFDEGAVPVPAILATQFGEGSGQGERAEDQELSRNKTYRICLGQTKLKSGKKTTSADVTSKESAHSIYGLTVVLKGYPVKGISLTADDGDVVIGSQKNIHATIEGDETFAELLDVGSLTWKSSNTAIATVDQNGVVTFKKKGKVTITATAKDGTKGTITFGSNGSSNSGTNSKDDDDKKTSSGGSSKSGSSSSGGSSTKVKGSSGTPLELELPEDNEGNSVSVGTITAKEVSIGNQIAAPVNISAQEELRAEMAEEAQALEENRSYSRAAGATAAGASAAACAAGVALRIRRFKLEV